MREYVVNRPDETAMRRALEAEPISPEGVVLRLAWQQGLSRDEIAGLTWEQVSFLDDRLELPDRMIPLDPEVRACLWRLFQAHSEVSPYSEWMPTTGTSLKYENGSLYVINTAKTGFSVSPDVKVVLCNADGKGDRWDEVDDTYTGYKGLEDAIDDLNHNFNGRVSAILENGVATTIILDCSTKDPGYDGGKETGSTDYVAYLVVGDTGEYDGKVSLVVKTKDGKNVTEAVDYKYTLTSSSLISDKQTSVEGSGAIAAGAQVDYVAFAAPNTMLSYQATVVIGNDTIVTDVLFG